VDATPSPHEKAAATPPPRTRRFEAALRRNLVGLVSEAKGLMGIEGIFMKVNPHACCSSKFCLWGYPHQAVGDP